MDNNCRAFQFKGSRPENCLFIHKIPADADGQIFKKKMLIQSMK